MTFCVWYQKYTKNTFNLWTEAISRCPPLLEDFGVKDEEVMDVDSIGLKADLHGKHLWCVMAAPWLHSVPSVISRHTERVSAAEPERPTSTAR